MADRRKLVPDDAARRLVQARKDRDTAAAAFEQAVVDALRAGGSLREIAPLADLSPRTVQMIGERHGWPDGDELRRREAERAERERWRRLVDEYLDE